MMVKYALAFILMMEVVSFHAQVQEFTDKYSNGNKRSEGNYLSGFEDGEWKYYFEDGSLQEVSHYKNKSLQKRKIPRQCYALSSGW